ncbi:MAG: hypothetical protein HWN68_20155 [Desulfobacterales bacterium]|nr:hypothetical protein [Desulfobacterales bacterium]
MANEVDLTVAQIGLVDPLKARVKTYLAGEEITKGELVAMNTTGVIHPASGAAADYKAQQIVGVSLNAGNTGAAIDVCEDGELYGFTVSGLNCGALLYAHDTAGRISSAIGTVTAYVGRVTALTDKGTTNVIRIQTIFSEALVT